MTFRQELSSWWSMDNPPIEEPPHVGQKAPESPKLHLQAGRPAVITFLRHCGCPFAEKSYLNLREIAKDNKDIDFVAVSHSDEASTNKWLKSLPQAGSEPSNLRAVVDDRVEIYAAWGLGSSSYAHVLDPRSLYSALRMGREQNIWNRPTESGSRWQTAGSYAVDADGIVRWGGPTERADEICNFEEAVQSLQRGERTQAKL